MKTQESSVKELDYFFQLWKKPLRTKVSLPISEELQMEENTSFPAYCLSLPNLFVRDALAEVIKHKNRFITHRPNEGHLGWKGLTLHGIDLEKTMCPEDYGLDPDKTNYHWTEGGDLFPSIKDFFCNHYPSASYGRIRIMLIEPGGYILPHRDREKSHLGPLTIPLNTPKNCFFMVEGFGRLKLKQGLGYLIDISRKHCVWNKSAEPRFHIIVEARYGSRKKDFIELVLKSYPKNNPFYFCNKKYLKIKKRLFSFN